MDNVTHTLFGLALAASGLSKRVGRGTTATIVLASNMPDVDIVFALFQGEQGMLLRRGLTHSVLLLPLFALVLALLMKVFFRRQKLLALFFLSMLALAGHLFLDLLNSYGVVLLYPLSMKRFELAWTFIIDLWLAGLMAVPLLLGAAFRKRWRKEYFGQAALTLAFLYIGLCAFAHERASILLNRMSHSSAAAPQFEYVFPEVFGPRYFRGVQRTGNLYKVYLIDSWSGKSVLKIETETQDGDPRVEKAKNDPLAQRLLWFFKAPVWNVEEDGTTVSVFDLRFSSVLLNRSSKHFLFKFGGVQTSSPQ